MADLITGNTQLSATKQAIIAAVVQKELAFAAKLAPFAVDYSSWAVKGASSVKVPKAGSLTATNRATGTAGDASVLTFSTSDIALDQKAYVAWVVDSADEVQSRIEVQAEYARRAATAQGRYVDTNLISIMQSFATTITVGNLSQAIVLEMRQSLIAAFADPSMLYLAVGPDQEAKLLAIDTFVRSDAYGIYNQTTALESGVIGTVYGVKVVVHAGIAAGNFYMWEKNAMGLAFQAGVQMSDQPANQYGSQARRYAMDQLFGSALLQTSLAIRDNNP